jgi:hypothetical protein
MTLNANIKQNTIDTKAYLHRVRRNGKKYKGKRVEKLEKGTTILEVYLSIVILRRKTRNHKNIRFHHPGGQ